MGCANLIWVQIAGVEFAVSLPYEVKINKGFQPFITEKKEADCVVQFEEVKKLDLERGKLVVQKHAFEVWGLIDGTWERRYTGNGGKKTIAVSSLLSGNVERVKILPEARNRIVDIEQVFFRIALEEQLLHHGRWIIHASCVQTSLGAILFVGPSGMGKTTQAELWEKYRESKVLNGDRTIVYQENGVWYAAGSPYAGSSKRYVNQSAPICLVVLLEQGNENCIQSLMPGQAFRRLYPHLTVNDWNPWYVETIINQLNKFVRECPSVHFSCTPDETAVNALWKELTKKVGHE